MVEPVAYHIAVRQGTKFGLTLRFSKDGVATDFTGAEWVWTIRTKTGTIRKTTADGSIAMPTPTDGKITLRLTPLETRQLTVGRIDPYDLEYRSADDEQVYMTGYMDVTTGPNDDA